MEVRLAALPSAAVVALAGISLSGASCAPPMQSTLDRPPTRREIAQLWIKPAKIRSRDLFWGAGGRKWAPKPGTTFEIDEVDDSGSSGGWDLDAPDGREYSVKIGPESQVEVVLSRFIWAVGYHQPPQYLLTDYTLANPGPEDQPLTGRFRPDLDKDLADSVGEWSWHENPFVGTRELNGLLVLQLIFNNWDIKPSQNKIYDVVKPGRGPARWYVVRDLGAALGRTGWPVGTKNSPDDFETQNLIKEVTDGRVVFDYAGRHQELLAAITAEDVIWICDLMNQLTPKQYADAFRAGAYPEDVAKRYIAKIRSKVREGLSLKQTGAR